MQHTLPRLDVLRGQTDAAARAEAQTLRLALIYALLDGAREIDLVHIQVALAVWSAVRFWRSTRL